MMMNNKNNNIWLMVFISLIFVCICTCTIHTKADDTVTCKKLTNNKMSCDIKKDGKYSSRPKEIWVMPPRVKKNNEVCSKIKRGNKYILECN